MATKAFKDLQKDDNLYFLDPKTTKIKFAKVKQVITDITFTRVIYFKVAEELKTVYLNTNDIPTDSLIVNKDITSVIGGRKGMAPTMYATTKEEIEQWMKR